MSFNWRIITPPSAQPITYQQAKLHLRLPDDHDQTYVNLCIQSAAAAVANEIDGSLLSQTVQVTHYDIPGQRFYLPRGPVQSIESVTANGSLIASGLYTLEGAGTYDYLYCDELLAPPVVITFTAGYSTIPSDLLQAVLIQLSQFYEYRSDQSEKTLASVSNGLTRLYERYRRGPRVM